MKATDAQIRELAYTIAIQAGAIDRSYPATWTPEQLRAAVALIRGNVDTLAAWTAEVPS